MTLSLRVGRPARASFRQVTRNRLHRHTFFEPCLVEAGSGEFECADRIWNLEPGDLFIPDPGTAHEIRSLNTKDLEVSYTSFAILNERSQATGDEDAIILGFLAAHTGVVSGAGSLTFAFSDVFESLKDISSHTSRYLFGERMRLLALQLMAALTTVPDVVPETGDSPLDRAIASIEARLAEPLAVADIAADAHVSERTLRRVFAAGVGRTVSEEIQLRRVRRAATLLALRDTTVAEVGRRVGVADPAQFTRLFRKVMGVPPQRFRTMRTPASVEWALVGDVPMRTEVLES